MSSVTVPRWLLAGLAVALGASLLAVAYLMGRESLRAEPAVRAAPAGHVRPPVPPTATDVMAPAQAPATEVGEVRSPNGAPDHAVERPLALTPGSFAEPPTAAAPQVDVAAASRVAAYFARLDRIAGSGLNDPSQEAAQHLLAAALQGDTTTLDGMKTAAAVRAPRDPRRAARRTPPGTRSRSCER